MTSPILSIQCVKVSKLLSYRKKRKKEIKKELKLPACAVNYTSNKILRFHLQSMSPLWLWLIWVFIYFVMFYAVKANWKESINCNARETNLLFTRLRTNISHLTRMQLYMTRWTQTLVSWELSSILCYKKVTYLSPSFFFRDLSMKINK